MYCSTCSDLFVLFVGLELASLATYVLVGFHKETKSGAESGVKYFITGSVASGIGLYGLSLLYLEFGSLQLNTIAANWAESSVLGILALGLVLVDSVSRYLQHHSTLQHLTRMQEQTLRSQVYLQQPQRPWE